MTPPPQDESDDSTPKFRGDKEALGVWFVEGGSIQMGSFPPPGRRSRGPMRGGGPATSDKAHSVASDHPSGQETQSREVALETIVCCWNCEADRNAARL